MLWIISGPSSVGKSTFLESPRCREVTGLPSDAPVLFAFESGIGSRDLNDTLFHYNLLRPATRFRRRQAVAAKSWKGRLHRFLRGSASIERETAALRSAAIAFRQDPAWQAITGQPVQKKAVVLIADRDRILERVQHRREIERAMPEGASNSYKSEEWLWIYERLDLPELYRAWCAELKAAGIEYVTIDSNDPQFRLCPAP